MTLRPFFGKVATKTRVLGLLCLFGISAAVSLSRNRSSVVPSKKTVLITGGNRGIGFAAAKQLAATNDWQIILACRSQERAETAIKQIGSDAKNIEIAKLDLADLNDVRRFAKEFGSRPLDCLALNAGVQTGNRKEPLRSAQGYEATVATNHIGHFLLAKLLLQNVKKSRAGRVVIVGSGVHNPDEAGGNVGSKAGLGDLSGFKNGFKAPISMVDGSAFDPDKSYKDSKLCNVITSLELARRLAKERSKVTCNCMNPGLIPTSGLFREFNPIFVGVFTLLTRYVFKVAVSEEEGGRRLAYMISSPDLEGVNGKYFSGRPGKQEYFEITPSIEASDETKAKELWTLTDYLVK